MISKLIIWATIPALLMACSSGAPTGAPTPEQLKNATYHAVLDAPVTLQDGEYQGAPYSSMSASRPTVTLVESTRASGDVTGNGVDEAVVLLATNMGGSGVFFHLAVVRNHGGAPQHIGTIPLGDRVKVKSVAVIDGKIVTDLVEHGPGDPMCCPTRAVHREWELQGGELTELDTRHLQPTTRHRGHLVWGHEGRSFAECGSKRTGWVINESGKELLEVYQELTSEIYEPLFVEVSGNWADAPEQGFGADYPEAIRITEWHRAEREGWGCDLDLESVLFIAMGNEPSWRLDARDSGLVLTSMIDPQKRKFPPAEPIEVAGSIRLESATAEGSIQVMLEKQRCVDSMSGSRFEYVATITIDSQRLTGCAIRGLSYPDQ
jgi:uncharacterized membrane protein